MPTTQEQMVLQISADLSNVSRNIKKLGGDLKSLEQMIVNTFNKMGAAGEQAGNKIAASSNRTKRIMIQNAHEMADASIREQERVSAYAANNARNLSFQINDVLSALATGQGIRGVAQQFGQIAQSFSGTSVLQVLRGLLTTGNLLTIALTAAGAAAAYFFSSSEEDAKKLDEQLDSLLDKFGEIAGEEIKGPLAELAFDVKTEKAIKEVEEALDSMRLRAAKEFITVAVKMPKLDVTQFGGTRALEISNKIAESFNKVSDETAHASERVQALNDLITYLDQIELEKPGAGAAQMANYLRQSIPLLEDINSNYQALMELKQKIAALDAKTIEQAKAYNKALEEMREIGVPALTDMEKLMKHFMEAMAASGGDLAKIVNLFKELEAGIARIGQQSLEGLIEGGTLSDMDSYLNKIARVESGGDPNAKNPLSSASGLFQFTNKTFYDTARQMKEFQGMTKAAIMELKNVPGVQKIVVAELTRQNEEFLRKNNIVVSDATKYLAHFLGAQGAVDILKGRRGPTASEIQSNPFLAGMSNADILKWAQKKMGEAQTGQTTEDIQQQNDLLSEQVNIRGENKAGIDAEVAAEESKLKFAELYQEKQKQALQDFKDGKRETIELTQQEIDALKVQADEYGRIQGMKEATKDLETIEGRIAALQQENEELRIQAEQNGMTLESMQGLLDAKERQKAIDEAQVETSKILFNLKQADVPVTEAQAAAIRKLNEANALAEAGLKKFGETNKEVAKTQEQYSQQMAGIFKSAIGGFISDLRNGVSAGEAFANMLDRIIDGLINMALEMLFSKEALGALFGGGEGGGGFGWIGKIFGLNEGGIAGRDGKPMIGDMRKFRHARHMQSGGWAGGIPAMLHPGELVVPRRIVQGLGRSRGGNNIDQSSVSMGDINIDMAGTGLVAADNEKGRQFGQQIRLLIQGELVRESRPGGLLRKVPA